MPTIIQLAHEVTPLAFVRIEALLNRARWYDSNWNGVEFVIQMGDHTCILNEDTIRSHRLLGDIFDAIDMKPTIAQEVADALRNDGRNFEAPDGTTFEQLTADFGAEIEYANRTGERDEEGREIYKAGSKAGQFYGDPIRYVFSDGSAIVLAGDAWDIEGNTPFSWKF